MPVKIIKQDADGKEILHYFGEVVERSVDTVYIKAVFKLGDWDIHNVFTVRAGDYFHEWFYSNRWYNVFRIYDGESGHLKGWYCNITRPAVITNTHIAADDLALDVIVSAGREVFVVDHDEFELLNLTHAERQLCVQAVAEIRQRVEQQLPPFQPVLSIS